MDCDLSWDNSLSSWRCILLHNSPSSFCGTSSHVLVITSYSIHYTKLYEGRIPIRCSFRSEFLDKEGALRTARTTIHLSCRIKSSAQPIRNSSRRDVVIAFSDSFAIPESEIVAFLLSIVILKPQISVSMWQILLTKFRITPNWNRALRELLVGNPCPVVSIWMTLRRSWIGKGLRIRNNFV